MAELIAKSPLDGQDPIAKAGLILTVLPTSPLWSVALFPGVPPAALQEAGLDFPAPGQSVSAGDLALIWTGRDQAFLIGGPPPAALSGQAAVTDQTGAWAAFTLAGPGGEAALARLVSPDLRAFVFPRGAVLRAGLNHIPAIIQRSGEEEFTIRVFRSMAQSAWHELAEVLDRMESRKTAGS